MDDILGIVELIKGYIPWIVAMATIIGFVVKIRRDVVYKLKAEMGKDMLYLGFKMIREIFEEVPASKLFDFLKEFKRKYVLEGDMKDTVVTLSNIVKIQNTVIGLKKPAGKKVKKDRASVEMGNKKFLNKLRANQDFNSAIESMSIIINEQLKIQSKLTKDKMRPFVDEINEILNTAKSNIPRNREKRMDAEETRREMEVAKTDKEKIEIGKKLHGIFKH
jgi:hypothetical protein